MSTDTDWRQICGATGREQFRYIFHQGIFSDVKLIVSDGTDVSEVDKQVIPSHSLVLKIRSPVFEKIFEKLPKGKDTEIPIQGSVSEVKKFIQFLYTDEFETGCSAQELQKVLQLAKKYKVHVLVSKCTGNLISSMSIQDAASTYQIAKELNVIELEEFAFQYILCNVAEIVQQEDFSSLNQQNLCGILSNDDLDINELDLFLGLLKWAKVECSRYKIQDTPKHIRLVLKEALNLIRFPVLSRQDFLEVVVPTQILNEREVTEIMKYFDASLANRQYVIPAGFSNNQRMFVNQEDQLDLTKTDEETHRRLAKYALKKFRSGDMNENEVEIFKTRKFIKVSNLILEIVLKNPEDVEELKEGIPKIKKYGLYWGAFVPNGTKLLVSFSENDDCSYGVGEVVDEINDRFEDKIELVLIKSFKDDIIVHL